MQAIAEEHEGSAFEWATKPEDRTRLWKARHAAYYAAMALMPGSAGIRDRRLRADLSPRRLHSRDRADIDATGLVRADRRPRRRR
jgi:hypothetical protein